MSPKKANPKRRGGKYKLPDPIPNGEVLTDLRKNKWKLGASIGKGGFGEIYSASQVGATQGKDSYAVKIEPKENGPLFVEMHFMMKVCQPDDINNWMKMRKLSHLGIPRFIASGSHVCNERSYRFLVMEKYGQNLWKLFEENKKVFPLPTILQVGIQVLDVLEYIHSKGYIHGDVKGSNLLLGIKDSESSVFLIDFGLATRYTTREYKKDPKFAHNGTIEYLSRDAHLGVMTRRGDLEILAYNMLQWASSHLPWEKKAPNNILVHEDKMSYMEDIPCLMKYCFKDLKPPSAIVKYFNYVVNLSYEEEPNYEFCRNIFWDGLKPNKGGKLIFSSKVEARSKVKASPSRKVLKEEENEEEVQEDIPAVKKRAAVSRKVLNEEAKLVVPETRSKRVSPKRKSGEIEKSAVAKRVRKLV